jgi:hypothetical protein
MLSTGDVRVSSFQCLDSSVANAACGGMAVPHCYALYFYITFSLLQAIATLYIWSYVHLTYVVDPEDCLTDVKERPLSYEVILQVSLLLNQRHTAALLGMASGSNIDLCITILICQYEVLI